MRFWSSDRLRWSHANTLTPSEKIAATTGATIRRSIMPGLFHIYRDFIIDVFHNLIYLLLATPIL